MYDKLNKNVKNAKKNIINISSTSSFEWNTDVFVASPTSMKLYLELCYITVLLHSLTWVYLIIHFLKRFIIGKDFDDGRYKRYNKVI